ncbi:MAG: Maf family protein [Nanoarchaeota archaeon]|nr:Maf family protein [Nanoarchaeota archaeon]
MRDKIILATTSPHRRKAFASLGYGFVCEGSDVDERFEDRPSSPSDLVRVLSRLKAEGVASRHKEGIVIGFDSVGYSRGEVLEKPRSFYEGFERLNFLSGQEGTFFTGVCVINAGESSIGDVCDVSRTNFKMNNLDPNEIRDYLLSDPRFDTYALGFDLLSHFSLTFINEIHGSYNNILHGIPLEMIPGMLREVSGR